MRLDIMTASANLENAQDYAQFTPQIPFINFGSDLEVKVIPPFNGAMIRFLVKKPNQEKTISVYLDCHAILGYMPYPYWEIYPYETDTARFKIDEIESMLKAIREELDRKE